MNGFIDNILSYREGVGIYSVDSIVLCLLTTFLISSIAAWIYVKTHRGVSYSGTMARSLIILSLVVALVMMVIGNNIARAFGLFGALALIRFRTPVKDANDTVFLFLAVAIGIAMGTGNILIGVVGTMLICAIYYYLSSTRFGNRLNHNGLLRFHLPAGVVQDDSVRKVLNQHCNAFNLLHLRETDHGSSVEFSYQIDMFDTDSCPYLISEIEEIKGISHLSLLMQDQEVTP